jgi:hypothetical protein
MESFDEIRENEPFNQDDFFEFVKGNLIDWLENSTEKEIRRELVILNDEGEVLD